MTRPIEAVGENTRLAFRKRRAGQRLIIGFSGQAVSADLRSLVRAVQPGGFVLFKRNCTELGQIHDLIRALKELCKTPPLIAIDHEGGAISRLPPPAIAWPDAQTVGRSGVNTALIGAAMATELRALGITLNLGPVGDIRSTEHRSIIHQRAYGSTAQQVTQSIVSYIQAHQQEGVACCVKHFPGHGCTELDSHLTLPTVPHESYSTDHTQAPFIAAIQAKVQAMMVAHIHYPSLDPAHAAPFSEAILRRRCREELGFSGVLLSDDLEMKALHTHSDPVLREQLGQATSATLDSFLVCHSAEYQWRCFEALLGLQEQSAHIERHSEDSVSRITQLKETLYAKSDRPMPTLAQIGRDAHQALLRQIHLLGKEKTAEH